MPRTAVRLSAETDYCLSPDPAGRVVRQLYVTGVFFSEEHVVWKVSFLPVS